MNRTMDTIVMVDDDLADIYITKRRLSESNINKEFIFENDARQLFETLQDIFVGDSENSNIVILLDMNMPRMNGVEVLRELRDHENYRHIPILMLCGSDDTEDMVQSYECGADGYLTKPIDPSEMMGFIGAMRSGENSAII